MLRLRLAVVAITMCASALPASAAVIGLAGGDTDPQEITAPTFQILTAGSCSFATVALPANFRCALYDPTDQFSLPGIFGIDVRLLDGFGHLLPFPSGITAGPSSGLPFLAASDLFNDHVTFGLSTDPDTPFVCGVTCIFFASHDNGLFDPAAVSMAAVNDIINQGAAVPEPSVLLMGVAAVAARLTSRRWRRTAARIAGR